jgi:long-chain acyl-CoA synthetase
MDQIETLQALLPRLDSFGKQTAVIAFTKEAKAEWSYAKLSDCAARLATGLLKEGVEKGEVLAICAEDSPEWITACLATIASGATAAPLDVQLSDDALDHTLRDSGARYVFTSERQLKRVRRFAREAGCKPILLGERGHGLRGWQDYAAESAEPFPTVSPDDRAVLFYTSGTTGPPKGVPLTHRNLAFQVNTLLAAELVSREDRVLLPLPLHHVYPFTIGILTPLAIGLPIVFPYTLTGPQLMRALREGGVTTIVGVPRLYSALMSGIQTRVKAQGRLANIGFTAALALSTALARARLRVGRMLFRQLHQEMGPQLRVLASGGAAIDPDLARKLEGLGWLIGTGYGLTETSPLLTLDKPGDARIGSVGKPIAGVDVRIDPVADGTEKKPRKKKKSSSRRSSQPQSEPGEGEVVANGPGVFAGYHHLPDETKKAFTKDGWFRTGDLGRFDKQGYLFITGRVKTLIVLEGGEKVQPDDVEEAYQASDAIGEIGVLERDGKLVAIIRPKRGASGQQTSEEDGADDAVRKALEDRAHSLASYKRIADFVLTKSPLPRTRLGKIRREELKELFEQLKKGHKQPEQAGPIAEEEMSPEDRALLDDSAARKTWEWLARRYASHRLTPETSPQMDLGIDSLEWLNLTLEIRECCGVELSEDAISRIETVRDLLREVVEQPAGGRKAPAVDPLENPDEVLGEEKEHWLSPPSHVEAAAGRCLYALDWMLVHSGFRLRVKGRERLPEKGPVILAPNHVSYLDSFVLAAALDYDLLRNTYWAGWSGVAFGPLFRLLRRLTHVVPIDPDRAAASSLAYGAAVLRDKHNLVWYPEGTHSKTGELMRLRPGIGMLLARYHVPVVPVHLEGTRDSLPPGRWIPRPGKVEITFGPPLDPKDLEKEGKGDEPYERITDALHDAMEQLARS